ncbi:MAG: nicotinate (nicotinamide) nucleotide adenylyltransferase [Clostridia bacterium]|nr:nicotinate (nicotinamide) nucleotide adenylyltransferase [Clostridia bacterium]
MKIALFGGTFDPPHNEHVRLLRAASKQLKADKIIVMPAGIPPHKSRVVTDGAHRLAMAKLAFSDIPNVEVSDWEISQQGKSYTLLTLQELKKRYPDAELVFLMGADMLLDFPTWYHPEEIVSLAQICVFLRGNEISTARQAKSFFYQRFHQKCKVLRFRGKDISSTKARVLTEFGQSTAEILPPKVEEYIKQNGLYTPSQEVKTALALLTPKRARHTAYVVIAALKKANELGVPKEKAYLACALHDIAKKKTPKDVSDCPLPNDLPKAVWHQYLGAHLAKTQCGVTDEEVLNAISYHTSARPQMTALEKLVFTADMIEETRNFRGVKRLQKMYEKNFEDCFFYSLKDTYFHVKRKKAELYPLTEQAYIYYKNLRKQEKGAKK